jgi:hypothetical protein
MLEALISVLSAAVVIASILNRKSALPFHLPKRRPAIAARDHAAGKLFIRPLATKRNCGAYGGGGHERKYERQAGRLAFRKGMERRSLV